MKIDNLLLIKFKENTVSLNKNEKGWVRLKTKANIEQSHAQVCHELYSESIRAS